MAPAPPSISPSRAPPLRHCTAIRQHPDRTVPFRDQLIYPPAPPPPGVKPSGHQPPRRPAAVVVDECGPVPRQNGADAISQPVVLDRHDDHDMPRLDLLQVPPRVLRLEAERTEYVARPPPRIP